MVNWKSPSPTGGLYEAEPSFKVVDLPGKGKGMVADRDIEVSYGELLDV